MQVLTPQQASELWAEHDDRGSSLPGTVIAVASAEQGVDNALASVWERWAENAATRVVALTHLDVGRVDDDELRLICEAVLGEPLVAMTLPLADDEEEIAGTLDLVTLQITDDLTGTTRAADPEHISFSAAARALVEESVLAVTDDEALVSASMLGLTMSPDHVAREIVQWTRAGMLVPAFVATTPAPPRPAVGINSLVEFLQRVMATD